MKEEEEGEEEEEEEEEKEEEEVEVVRGDCFCNAHPLLTCLEEYFRLAFNCSYLCVNLPS